ncbi:MAG: hypothetical protein OEO83_09575, partial [Alphaproteobacteria bacterium]|nr:hypothetical protein [Alphaproteobacteria bacterium]
TVFIIAILVAAVVTASQWQLRASIIILVLGSLGAVFATAQLVLDVTGRTRTGAAVSARPTMELPAFEDTDPRSTLWGTVEIWGWLLGLLALTFVTGLDLALPLFVLIYARFYGANWWLAGGLAVALGAFIFGVYDQIMHVYWPESILGDLFLDEWRGND